MLLVGLIVTAGLRTTSFPGSLPGNEAGLPIERSRFDSYPESLCCVLGQDTLLSQCLSPHRSINGYQQAVRETRRNAAGMGNLRWTSIPSRRSSNTLIHLMLRKSDKLRPCGPLGSCTYFTFSRLFLTMLFV